MSEFYIPLFVGLAFFVVVILIGLLVVIAQCYYPKVAQLLLWLLCGAFAGAYFWVIGQIIIALYNGA